MQLVGATRNFIRKPFVFKSIVHGIYGALIGNALLFAFIYFVEGQIEEFVGFDNYLMLAILFFGVIIIGITLLLFIHTLVPKNIFSIEFLSFEIGSFGFNSVHTFIWYFSHRLSLLILFSWCFIQSEHWWRWSLLSPIIFYTYQLWELFIRVRIDEIQNILYLSPILLLIVLIHLISKSIRKQFQTYQYKIMIENELEARIKEAGKLRNN